jgi:hypothetical protein
MFISLPWLSLTPVSAVEPADCVAIATMVGRHDESGRSAPFAMWTADSRRSD